MGMDFFRELLNGKKILGWPELETYLYVPRGDLQWAPCIPPPLGE